MCNLALSKEFINFGLKYHLIKIVATQLIQIDARLYLINFSKQFVQTSKSPEKTGTVVDILS